MSRPLAVAALVLVSAWAAAFPAGAVVPPGYDGAWHQLLPSGRSGHAAVVDPVGRTLWIFAGGGGTTTDHLLAYDLDPLPGTPGWRRLPTGTPTPGRMIDPTLAWDSRRHRLLEYGGLGDFDVHVSDSLWVYDPAGNGKWQAVATQGTSPGLPFLCAAAYDSVSDALLVFGGISRNGFTSASSLWSLSLATDPPTWTELPTTTDPNDGFNTGAMFVENDPHRLVRFQEVIPFDYAGARLVALPLDGSTDWIPIDSSRVLQRSLDRYDLVFERARRRLYALSGVSNDTLVLNWFDVGTPDGWHPHRVWCPGVRERFGFRLVADEPRHRLLAVCGELLDDDGAHSYEADAWWFDPDTSDVLHPLLGAAVVAPPPRVDAAATTDRSGRALWMYGGLDEGLPDHNELGDLWRLDETGSLWHRESRLADGPGPITGASAVFDARRHRFVLLGGNGPAGLRASVHEFDPATHAWSDLVPAGPGPSPREWAQALYDSTRDRVLWFGGWDGTARNDLWALELGTSPPRWRELHPTTGLLPAARLGYSAALDTRRNTWWIYGGFAAPPPSPQPTLRDAWQLSLTDDGLWSPLDTPDLPPAPRANAGAVYDAARDRLVFLWGANEAGQRRENAIAVTLGGVPDWRGVALLGFEPFPSSIFLCFWDDAHGELVEFGGRDNRSAISNDLWSVEWAAPVAAPPAASAVLRLTIGPNPSLAGIAARFELAAPSRIDCAVYDLRGRRLRTLANGVMPSGPVTVGWDGRDDRGARVGPGVYWARLRAAGGMQSFKFVLLH